MFKNRITSFINLHNERVCFSIASLYYRKVEGGKSLNYIFHPRFYFRFFKRIIIIFCNFFRFNHKLYQPYIGVLDAPKQNNHLVFKYIETSRELFFVFAGLKYFEEEDYLSATYIKALPIDKLSFKNFAKPLVSIIIPVHNQLNFTLNCLRAIKLNVSEKYSFEVIVVDDYSTDETQQTLIQICNLIYLRNITNVGFLKSCNLAVKQAKGKYICLLNNDTLVQKNWLESSVNTLISDESIGCVGSKLIYPYGLLQEAWGIIFSDASGINYGKHQHPKNSNYNFLREVDYCSGASLLFLKKDFEAIGGFDERFAPAYYEDIDFCFSIRELLKKKVVYQPLSVLVHFEGISSGKISNKLNVKSYQDINKNKFVDKWRKQLTLNHPIQQVNVAARKYLPAKNVLIIDSYLPFYDRESGSNRIYKLIHLIKNIGYNVVFAPLDGNLVEPYYSELIRDGIEVLIRNNGKLKFLHSINLAIINADIVWICRPNINIKFAKVILANNVKWVYDTVDLHHVRIARAIELFPENKKLLKEYEKFKALEIDIAKKANLTICITNVEQDELIKHGIISTAIVPNIHERKNKFNKSFTEREGIVFIGSYNHDPNVDAVLWLCNHIMPLVWQKLPNLKLTLLGNNPPAEVTELAKNPNVKVTGYIKDVSVYFENAKIFVAPLRYGAGMKGKIGQSLEYSLPVVTTTIGVEGMNLTHNVNVLIANETIEFADKIIELNQNIETWIRVQKNAEKAISAYLPTVVSSQLISLFESLDNK